MFQEQMKVYKKLNNSIHVKTLFQIKWFKKYLSLLFDLIQIKFHVYT